MTDRDGGSTRKSPTGSARALLWAGAALVFAAGAVLVAVWPRSHTPAVDARTASSSSAELATPSPSETARAVPAAWPPSKVTSVARPAVLPTTDFFSSDAPESIRKMHDVTAGGGILAMERMKELYQLGKDHPGDPRPHLLMAEDAMNRGWAAFAVSHYERAAREDPHAREDPRMLKDLIDVAAGNREASKGSEAVEAIYGATAVTAVEAALAAAGDKGDRERSQKLAALAESLSAKAP